MVFPTAFQALTSTLRASIFPLAVLRAPTLGSEPSSGANGHAFNTPKRPQTIEGKALQINTYLRTGVKMGSAWNWDKLAATGVSFDAVVDMVLETSEAHTVIDEENAQINSVSSFSAGFWGCGLVLVSRLWSQCAPGVGNIEWRRRPLGARGWLFHGNCGRLGRFPTQATSVVAPDRMVRVTSWAEKGITPDLNPGRWVPLGDATKLNFYRTGLPGPKAFFLEEFPVRAN